MRVEVSTSQICVMSLPKMLHILVIMHEMKLLENPDVVEQHKCTRS